MEIFLTALFLVVMFKLITGLSKFLRSVSSSQQDKENDLPAEFMKPGPARWIRAGEGFNFKGFSLKGGFVYFGSKLPGFDGKNDGCLIDHQLLLERGPSPDGAACSFSTGYDTLTPVQRAGYLAWLEGGRSGTGDQEKVYALLYFKGLERRLVMEGARGELGGPGREELRVEGLRLLDVFGENEKLLQALQKFLALDWAIYGDLDVIPDYLDFESGYGSDVFPAVIARFSTLMQPVPDKWALIWTITREISASDGSKKRTSDAFKSIFQIRYREKYGEGMILHPSRKPLSLYYRPSNPSLGDCRRITIPRLSDPFLIATPFRNIDALAEACEAELEGSAKSR
ncbi:MAG: TerB N-terminal domain-containing protein [Aminivibrio sp.]|jgi:hypothetical protein